MKVGGRKDVREEAGHLERLGFRYQGVDGAGHHVFDHPQHGEVIMACSPSAFHWRQHHRRRVAKAMGLNLVQVEALIHGQRSVGKRTRRPKGRARPRPLRLVKPEHVAPEVLAAPPVRKAPKDWAPTDPIDSARRARWAALQGENVRDRINNPFPWRQAA